MQVYYYRTPSGFEVDFYLPESRQLIQVSYELDDPHTRERELRALVEALQNLKLQHGLLLKNTNQKPIHRHGKVVHIQSMSEWLLGVSSKG
ncbi:MAG: hypothetical protein IBX69_08775 [Anaerolineales bacterium]|nr:hypothetical protein [Anaerolineales bacterium]